MTFLERFYWFRRNLLAFILLTIVTPFWVINGVYRSFKILFITDGSKVIDFPWNWQWKDD